MFALQVPALGIFVIWIDVGAILLHDKNFGSEHQYLVPFTGGEQVEVAPAPLEIEVLRQGPVSVNFDSGGLFHKLHGRRPVIRVTIGHFKI